MAGDGESGDLGFDIGASMDSVATDMGLAKGREREDPVVEDDELPEGGEAETPEPKLNGSEPAPETETPPQTRKPPKAWPQEQHERWSKLDPQTQEYLELREKQMLDGIDQYKGDAGYGKAIRDVLQPFDQVIQATGLTAPQAVQYLMNAHYRLTQGTPESRLAAYKKLGEDLKLSQPEPGKEMSPELRELTERQNRIESALTERQRAEYHEHATRVSQEVEKFASDPSHPYFDECADDIALYVKAGHELQDAYERAVHANPVTRAKEIARLQTEAADKLKAKSATEVAAARKAAGGNVRPAQSPKAPTEPTGTMEDTMRSTYRKIQERSH